MAVTPNYGWTVPTDQADSGTWGAELNQTLYAIDAQVKSNQNNIPTFTPVQQGGVTGQQNNKINIGYDGNRIVGAVDGNTAFGTFVMTGAPVGFVKVNGNASNPQIYASTSGPSGGQDGDMWFQYT